jgi:SAM-dependent methyltransferase
VRILYPSTIATTDVHSSSYYVPTYNLVGAHREISRCRACGFAFVTSAMPEDELNRAYAEMEDPDYLREASAYRRAADFLLSRLEPYRAEASHLLEIGCGAGFLLERAHARGWEVRGIELSRWMVEQARQRIPGDRVRQGSYSSDHFRDMAFDVTIAVDVIEHLPDPAHYLADAVSRLKPGGILCVVTPDMGSPVARVLGERWWYVQIPHLSYFGRGSLTRLAARCGLEIVWCGAYPRFVTAAMVRHRLGALPGWTRGAANALVSPLFALRETLRFDLGDQLTLLCRKAG